ncbi:MAG: tetratricopeptide repeat protein [Candidatus Latescibacteria bacterium]|nr:tetratricopeptide repeat protein [Candidatus Latescibacterota bacterium]
MRRHIVGGLVAALALTTGCSDMKGMATRYRAERMLDEARREETRLRVGNQRPDSTTLLRIHDAYSRLRGAFPAPFVDGDGAAAKALNAAMARLVGTAELTAARSAFRAGRADLALEHAKWVASVASADTGLAREADFAAVVALQGLRRFEDAIELLHGMLERYPPTPPPSMDRLDAVLEIPDGIVGIRTQLGDPEGARREQEKAVEYYRRILASSPLPLLDAQVRSRLIRMLLETGDTGSALSEITALRRLISLEPSLKSLEPEILYSEARIRGVAKDPGPALDLFDRLVMAYPGSRFGARALLDAGVLLEKHRDHAGALARYRTLLDRDPPDPEATPVAAFRLAMLEDQLGNWEDAKRTLDGIPVRFPTSRAAIEAPFAIVDHYARSRQFDATKLALHRAIDTYRKLIARDTTSASCTAYRRNIMRAYEGLELWDDALSVADEMAARDRGAAATSHALFVASQIADKIGDKSLSNSYLKKIVLEYPRFPLLELVKKRLRGRGAGTTAG